MTGKSTHYLQLVPQRNHTGMKESSRIDVLISIATPFWPLYGWHILGFIIGYSLKWWCTSLNVMPEKQTGNININKLRTILLFQGDFNNNNKLLCQAVMFHAEKLQLIAKEQYGSCKEKSATVQCLNKCMLYNYVCIRHIPLAICLNNAKSCYGQIVMIVSALCLC